VPKMLHDDYLVMDELRCRLMLHDCFVGLGVLHYLCSLIDSVSD